MDVPSQRANLPAQSSAIFNPVCTRVVLTNHHNCNLSACDPWVFLRFMASGTHRKKLNKRPNFSKPLNSPMASSRPAPPNYRKPSIYFLVLFIFCVFGLLGVSSNMWRNFNSDAVSLAIYSIEVVNEFPHDPAAFTQVNPLPKISFLVLVHENLCWTYEFLIICIYRN